MKVNTYLAGVDLNRPLKTVVGADEADAHVHIGVAAHASAVPAATSPAHFAIADAPHDRNGPDGWPNLPRGALDKSGFHEAPTDTGKFQHVNSHSHALDPASLGLQLTAKRNMGAGDASVNAGYRRAQAEMVAKNFPRGGGVKV